MGDDRTQIPSAGYERMSVEFLAAVIEGVAQPVFVKDRDFRFVIVNRAACEMVGYRREAMIGKTDYDFFPKDEADFFRQKDIELFSSGVTVQIEEEPITDANGTLHILATTKVPIHVDGRVTHLVGIISDITRIKEVEEVLRNANEDLEERFAMRTDELAAAHRELVRNERLAVLGQLAGGLAHQLRNPLAAIQNAVALLRRVVIAEHDLDVLSIIDEEVRRADRTIRDLLDYARIRPPTQQMVVMSALIEQAIDHEHPPEGVDLRTEVDEGALAFADPSQLLAALGNLIRNAIEAVAQQPRAVVKVAVLVIGDRVHVTVSDSGLGVPEEARHRLFEPLVTTKPLGIGLGLSIARNLIQNQGGSIRLVPSELGGAAFVIELPAAPGPHDKHPT